MLLILLITKAQLLQCHSHYQTLISGPWLQTFVHHWFKLLR